MQVQPAEVHDGSEALSSDKDGALSTHSPAALVPGALSAGDESCLAAHTLYPRLASDPRLVPSSPSSGTKTGASFALVSTCRVGTMCLSPRMAPFLPTRIWLNAHNILPMQCPNGSEDHWLQDQELVMASIPLSQEPV